MIKNDHEQRNESRRRYVDKFADQKPVRKNDQQRKRQLPHAAEKLERYNSAKNFTNKKGANENKGDHNYKDNRNSKSQ